MHQCLMGFANWIEVLAEAPFLFFFLSCLGQVEYATLKDEHEPQAQLPGLVVYDLFYFFAPFLLGASKALDH